MASTNTSWSEENFSCSICLDVSSSPSWLLSLEQPYESSLMLNQQKFPVTLYLDPAEGRECFMSFCQTHLEPHQRFPVLKKHRLVEPMDRLEERVCKKHDRFLELFCQTEQRREEFNQTVIEKLKSTEKQAEDLIKELEQEIDDLTNRFSEVLDDGGGPSYVGTLRRSLNQLEETLNMEMKKLRGDAEQKEVQQYEVTLDSDTAYPMIILSEDGKQV
ncbi:unnamed protein product [Arctogadus glacialis]